MHTAPVSCAAGDSASWPAGRPRPRPAQLLLLLLLSLVLTPLANLQEREGGGGRSSEPPFFMPEEMPQLNVAVVLKSVVLGALVYVLAQYRRASQDRAADKARNRPAEPSDGGAAATSGGSTAGAAQGGGEKAGEAMPALTVLFASQTGTAEGFATTIGQEARQQGFAARVECVEDYTDEGVEQLMEEELLVLVAATYGEGEPTDDALQFTKWLRLEDHETDCLSKVNFTVFGLVRRMIVATHSLPAPPCTKCTHSAGRWHSGGCELILGGRWAG
jgi:flavodoxin